MTPEEIESVKAQLRAEAVRLPPQQREATEAKIREMSDDEVIAFVEQQQGKGEGQQIFRMIVEAKIPSVKLFDNEDAIAVLSVKAISEGHVLVIPRTPVQTIKQLPPGASSLASEIAAKLTSNLKAQVAATHPEFAFGELVLNVLPMYSEPLSMDSPRTDKTPEELEALRQRINAEGYGGNGQALKTRIRKFPFVPAEKTPWGTRKIP